MKATVGRIELTRTLRWIQTYLKANGMIRHLEIHLEVRPDDLRFIVQQDEHSRLEVSLPAEQTTVGAILINTQKLLRFIKVLPGEFVDLACGKPPRLIVTSENCRFDLSCSEDKEPVALKQKKRKTIATFTGTELRQTLTKLVPSMGTDAFSRSDLCSVHFHNKNEKLTLCTTDGQRLTLVAFKDQIPPEEPCNIPSSVIKAIRPAVAYHGKWTILTGEKTIEIHTERYHLLALAHNKYRFPNYSTVIPPLNKTKVATLDVQRLKKALVRCTVLKNHTMCTRFTFNGDSLVLSVGGHENQYTETLDNIPCTLPQFTVGMNCRYLLEIIKGVDAKKPLEMYFSRPLDPLLFPSGDDTFVLMPMRLHDRL